LAEHSENTSEVKWETATPTSKRVAAKRVSLWRPPILTLYVASHVIHLPLPVIRKYIVGPRNGLEVVLLTSLIWMMLHRHTLVSTANLLLIYTPLNAENPVEILLCAKCRHLCFLEKYV
jgi:hypothetical protein